MVSVDSLKNTGFATYSLTLPFPILIRSYYRAHLSKFIQEDDNFAGMKGLPDIREEVFTEVLEDIDQPFHLIVWNDDVNTFEWVIETLIEICKHSYEQAEQCAYIIHFKGKYAVKHGSYDELKPMREAITERGINATLETVPV